MLGRTLDVDLPSKLMLGVRICFTVGRARTGLGTDVRTVRICIPLYKHKKKDVAYTVPK
jgi:hypothetical protein